MGMGGISIWQLLIVLVIVLLLFGTKRLRNLGGDLGGAIKGFKKAMHDEDANKSLPDQNDQANQTGQANPNGHANPNGQTIDATAKKTEPENTNSNSAPKS